MSHLTFISRYELALSHHFLGLAGHLKNLGFFSECDEMPWRAWSKGMSCATGCVENGLWAKKYGSRETIQETI